MDRLIVVCEGETETAFCRDVLAPHLLSFGLRVQAPRLKHSGGGDVRWSKLYTQLHTTLRSDLSAYVTTLVDYYGRSQPDEWPTAAAASAKATVRDRVALLEEGMRGALATVSQDRFLPYLQLHEFETLLFSDPATVAAYVDGDTDRLIAELNAVVKSCGEPELINDRRDTSPSHRLATLAPGYSKGLFGALLAREIGLERMRGACPGFAAWVGRLEDLGQTQPSSA